MLHLEVVMGNSFLLLEHGWFCGNIGITDLHVWVLPLKGATFLLCGETLTSDNPAGQSHMLGNHRIVPGACFVSQYAQISFINC